MGRRKKTVQAQRAVSPRAWLWSLLFLHLGLSPVLFSAATLEPFDYPKSLLLQLAGAMAAAWMVAALISNRANATPSTTPNRRPWNDPLAMGFALFGVSAVLSTAFSISPRTSLAGAADSFAGLPTLLSGVVLFFVTRQACGSWADGQKLLLAPMVGAAIAASYAGLQAMGVDVFSWSRVATFSGTRPFGTLGNANALSSFLAAAWPIQVCFSVICWRRGRGFPAAVLAASALLGAVVIARSASRAGWLGLFLGLAGVLVLLLRTGEKALARRFVAGLAAAAVAVGALGLLTPSGREWMDLLGARLFGGAGFESRWFLWTTAVQLFREHPILGAGVDTFGLAFNARRTPEFWNLEWNTTFVRAHNEGLQLLATQGALGAASALVILFGAARAARVAWGKTLGEERLCLGAVVVAIVSLLPQASLGLLQTAPLALLITLIALVSVAGREPGSANDVTPQRALNLARTVAILGPVVLLLNASAWQEDQGKWIPALLAFSLPLLALTLIRPVALPAAAAQRDGPAPRMAHVMGAMAVALLVALFLLYPRVTANAAAAKSMRLGPSDREAALTAIERAVALDPGNPGHWSRLGLSAQAVARGLPAAAGPALRQRSQEALTRAVSLEPLESQYKMLLCRALTDQALALETSAAQAFAACDRAIAQAPANPYFHTAAVNAAFELGDLARARRLALSGLALYPRLGPLQYQLGFIALREGRLEEASHVLAGAVEADWHGQDASREAARKALTEAIRLRGSLRSTR